MAESATDYSAKTLPSGAKVIYEYTGKNYRVPGLFYEDNFKNMKMVVMDDIPSKQDLEVLLSQATPDLLVSPWPIQVIRGYKNYLPSTFKRITSNMPEEMVQKYFGISRDWVPEKESALLQLQSELSSKSATMYAAIIHHRRDMGTIISKIHNLNRLYNIGRMQGFVGKRDYPLLFGDVKKKKNWDEILFRVKSAFEELMEEVPIGNRQYPRQKKKINLSGKEIRRRYPHVEYLKSKLGDNLAAILVYGSSAREEDPSNYGDFDNWVMVRDIRAAYEALKGTSPNVIDGKVEELRDVDDDDLPKHAKHVGINLLPESEERVYRHIRFLHDSREFLLHTNVVYGEFPFEKSALQEVVPRGLSNAAVKSKTLLGMLNWAYARPDKIRGKPKLFEFVVKIPRFFLQHVLNAEGKPKFRDKHQLDKILSEAYDIKIPAYTNDPEKIKEIVKQTTADIFKLKKAFIGVEADRKPDLSFLTDNRKFEWTQGSAIDLW